MDMLENPTTKKNKENKWTKKITEWSLKGVTKRD